MADAEVIIVGAGLAGLSCASALSDAGVSFSLLEQAAAVGGRVQTDELDGFQLDRGFQVLLTAYPEARRLLDYDALQLGRFEPGALIRYHGSFHRLVDPWRRPLHLLATALSGVATPVDKLRVAALRRRLTRTSLSELHRSPETSTLQRLRENGFSDRIIEHFFRPFLGGIFLERQLETSSRKFEFVFRMFSEGDAALPAGGMQAIPRQLAEALPAASVLTSHKVAAVRRDGVTLDDGSQRTAKAVVVATNPRAAARLLGGEVAQTLNSVGCLYFAADRPPLEEAILVLNGEGQGPINNLCVPTQVAPSYSRDGRALISVTTFDHLEADDSDLKEAVTDQLIAWFGDDAKSWQHLRTYRIDNAIACQTSLDPVEQPVQRPDGIFVCGDYLDIASSQGALSAGRRAADRVVKTLRSS